MSKPFVLMRRTGGQVKFVRELDSETEGRVWASEDPSLFVLPRTRALKLWLSATQRQDYSGTIGRR
jgi:hypothetical protein